MGITLVSCEMRALIRSFQSGGRGDPPVLLSRCRWGCCRFWSEAHDLTHKIVGTPVKMVVLAPAAILLSGGLTAFSFSFQP